MTKIKPLLFSSLLLLCILNIKSTTVTAQQYSELITEINIKIDQAYERILQAEKAGANIDELTDKINEANILYQEIANQVDTIQLSEGEVLADEIRTLCSEIEGEANILLDTATLKGRTQKQRYLYFSIGAAVLVIISSYYLWPRFKQHYLKRILTLKPEVVTDEP